MIDDLSKYHRPITTLFNTDQSEHYRLTNDQIEFFHTNGYLAGIRLLNDEQIAALRDELAELVDTNHPGTDLFYEFHSNESTDPSMVLFHALGARRTNPGSRDCLWHPAPPPPPPP